MNRKLAVFAGASILLAASSALADTWIAFVGGTGLLYSGRWYASSGVGFGDTQWQPVDQAMAACNKNGCRFVTEFTYGRYYITTGSNQYGGVAVGYGPSPAAAVYAAQVYGATSVNRPSGGCMDEFGQFYPY